MVSCGLAGLADSHMRDCIAELFCAAKSSRHGGSMSGGLVHEAGSLPSPVHCVLEV